MRVNRNSMVPKWIKSMAKWKFRFYHFCLLFPLWLALVLCNFKCCLEQGNALEEHAQNTTLNLTGIIFKAVSLKNSANLLTFSLKGLHHDLTLVVSFYFFIFCEILRPNLQFKISLPWYSVFKFIVHNIKSSYECAIPHRNTCTACSS